MNVKTKRIVTLMMAVLMAAAIVLPALSARADASNAGAQYFTDVTPDKWYYEAVNAMAAAGILNGYGDGTFKPNSPMTAGELATVLWNMVYGKDWCKANELFNCFNNGYAGADYSNPNYPGPRVEKWGRVLDGWTSYRVGSHNVYPNTWDGGAALAIYGDKRIDPKNGNEPHKNATIQISQGRFCGTTYSAYSNEALQADTVYFRDMSGLAVVAMSKEHVTRGFAISELVNVLRETGNLQKLYNNSGAKTLYANGSAIPDWAAITNAYHDVCASSRKGTETSFLVPEKYRFHDYTWAWNYIDDPGNIKISGGYANTWFSRDVLLAYQAGIVDGVDATGRCNVNAKMTRAEVCQMLYNAGVGKTQLKPTVDNGTYSNILFIRDGKAYLANPVASRTACVYISGFGPYNINSGRVPNTDGSNNPNYADIYYPNGAIDIRQQEWPTHPEFWGK